MFSVDSWLFQNPPTQSKGTLVVIAADKFRWTKTFLMTKEKQYDLSIGRTDDFIAAGVALFQWLDKLNKPKIAVLNSKRTKVITVDKKSSEIIKLDFDFIPLAEKFFYWRHSSKDTFDLNAEETDLFFECCRVAKLHLDKQKYNIGDNRDYINSLHDTVFNQLALNRRRASVSVDICIRPVSKN